jgi:hypothetical protein
MSPSVKQEEMVWVTARTAAPLTDSIDQALSRGLLPFLGRPGLWAQDLLPLGEQLATLPSGLHKSYSPGSRPTAALQKFRECCL